MIRTWLVMSLLVAAPPPVAAPKRDGGTPVMGAALKSPVFVDADTLKWELKQQRIIYTGHVKVRRGTTKITCDRLVAHYREGQEIYRVLCDGSVVVTDKDRWVSGEHGDFDNDRGLLVMTGNPRARQGASELTGDRILYNLNNDTIEAQNVRSTVDAADRTLKGSPKDGGR